MKLILVRHGESVGNFENRLQGHEDFPLTELGRRQAEVTGDRLQAMGISALYTSPLLRAFSTAELIGSKTGLEPVTLPGVSEYHFGELAGQTYADLRRRFGTQQPSGAQPVERIYPGEEGRENFYRRVTESIWSVVRENQGKTAAVVSHGGPIALFCQTVLGLPYRRPMPFALGNCSLTIIQVDAPDSSATGGLVLAGLNDDCHLKPLRLE